MSEDEYQIETRARVVLFASIVVLAVMIGAGYYVNSLPRSPLPESPRPPEPHMSPFVPSNETWGFESGSGARSLDEFVKLYTPGLIGAAIFVLASLVVLFYAQSRKERKP